MTSKELYWQERIAEHEITNSSALHFCAAQKLCYKSFLSWRKRLKEPSGFVELVDTQTIDLSCGGIHLSLRPDIELGLLSRVIAALHTASTLP